MPRQANLIPTVPRKIWIKHTVSDEVDKRLFNPVLGKPAYGALSALIEELLVDWIKRQPLNPKSQEIFDKQRREEINEL